MVEKMRQKFKVVKFIDGKARIIITDNLSQYKEDGRSVFFDPDLKACKGIPPELWTVEAGKILPHSEEKAEELKKIYHSCPKHPKDIEISKLRRQLRFYKAASMILASLSVLHFLIKGSF